MLHTLQYPKQKLFEPIENYYDKGRGDATENWHTSKQALLLVRDTLRNRFVGTCKANKKDIPKDGLFQKIGRVAKINEVLVNKRLLLKMVKTITSLHGKTTNQCRFYLH